MTRASLTPEQDLIFQARAEEADVATNAMIHGLLKTWGEADLDAGFVDSRLTVRPLLAGIMAILAEIAWDTAPPGSSIEVVSHAFCASAYPHLEQLAVERESGKLITESAAIAVDEGYGATRQ